MANVRGCDLPDDLYYNVENNVWTRLESDGTITIGMTSYACAMAGVIVSYTPKKVGKEVEQGKSVCTVESGKWVGPVKAPVAGEIIAINDAVADDPSLVNADPYGNGWMLKMRPFDWAAECGELVTGKDIPGVFEEKMNAEGFGGC